MSKKLVAVVVGGLVFFVVQFALSFVTGMVIHEGVLHDSYRATSQFWRPELNQDPPDMAALMPTWIVIGLVTALLFAALYLTLRGCLTGGAWAKGAKFGVVWVLVVGVTALNLSSVFALPANIWVWWCVDWTILTIVPGAVLGWVMQKMAPQ